jgi:hypothetical protein
MCFELSLGRNNGAIRDVESEAIAPESLACFSNGFVKIEKVTIATATSHSKIRLQ